MTIALQGAVGELTFKVQVTRAETGQVEEHTLVGFLDEEQLKAFQEAQAAEQAQKAQAKAHAQAQEAAADAELAAADVAHLESDAESVPQAVQAAPEEESRDGSPYNRGT